MFLFQFLLGGTKKGEIDYGYAGRALSSSSLEPRNNDSVRVLSETKYKNTLFFVNKILQESERVKLIQFSSFFTSHIAWTLSKYKNLQNNKLTE